MFWCVSAYHRCRDKHLLSLLSSVMVQLYTLKLGQGSVYTGMAGFGSVHTVPRVESVYE